MEALLGEKILASIQGDDKTWKQRFKETYLSVKRVQNSFRALRDLGFFSDHICLGAEERRIVDHKYELFLEEQKSVEQTENNYDFPPAYRELLRHLEFSIRISIWPDPDEEDDEDEYESENMITFFNKPCLGNEGVVIGAWDDIDQVYDAPTETYMEMSLNSPNYGRLRWPNRKLECSLEELLEHMVEFIRGREDRTNQPKEIIAEHLFGILATLKKLAQVRILYLLILQFNPAVLMDNIDQLNQLMKDFVLKDSAFTFDQWLRFKTFELSDWENRYKIDLQHFEQEEC